MKKLSPLNYPHPITWSDSVRVLPKMYKSDWKIIHPVILGTLSIAKRTLVKNFQISDCFHIDCEKYIAPFYFDKKMQWIKEPDQGIVFL